MPALYMLLVVAVLISLVALFMPKQQPTGDAPATNGRRATSAGFKSPTSK